MAAACPTCEAPIISARIKVGSGYKLIAVERCADGRGDLAIFPALFADGHPPIAEVVCNGTSYRRHSTRCRPVTHSRPFNQRLKPDGP